MCMHFVMRLKSFRIRLLLYYYKWLNYDYKHHSIMTQLKIAISHVRYVSHLNPMKSSTIFCFHRCLSKRFPSIQKLYYGIFIVQFIMHCAYYNSNFSRLIPYNMFCAFLVDSILLWICNGLLMTTDRKTFVFSKHFYGKPNTPIRIWGIY